MLQILKTKKKKNKLSEINFERELKIQKYKHSKQMN